MSRMIQRVTFPDDCELTPTGMTIPPGKPIQEWEGIVITINQAIRRKEMELLALKWYRADALNYGEREYGEKYAQAILVTGRAAQTLMNECWTAEKIPQERRRGLSFAHHAEVAALPASHADALLDMAEMDNVTAKELRALVQDHRMRESGKDPLKERARAALDAARVALEKLPRQVRAQMIVERLIKPLADVAKKEREQFLSAVVGGVCDIK